MPFNFWQVEVRLRCCFCDAISTCWRAYFSLRVGERTPVCGLALVALGPWGRQRRARESERLGPPARTQPKCTQRAWLVRVHAYVSGFVSTPPWRSVSKCTAVAAAALDAVFLGMSDRLRPPPPLDTRWGAQCYALRRVATYSSLKLGGKQMAGHACFGPNSADLGPKSTKLGQIRPDFDQGRVLF